MRIRRRSFIGSIAAGSVLAAAGCVEDVSENGPESDERNDTAENEPEDDDSGSESGDNATDDDEVDTEGDSDAEATLQALFEARSVGDVETQEQYIHPDSPDVEPESEQVELTIHSIEQQPLTELTVEDSTETEAESDADEFERSAFVYADYETDEYGAEEQVFLLVDTGASWQVYTLYPIDDDATGDASDEGVTSLVQVIDATGVVGEDETIVEAELVVTQTPGSDSIDLTGIELDVMTDAGGRTVTHDLASPDEIDSDDLADGSFGTYAIAGDDPATLTNTSDRIGVVFPIDLQAGATAEVAITHPDGAVTVATLDAPDQLAEPDATVSL